MELVGREKVSDGEFEGEEGVDGFGAWVWLFEFGLGLE